MPSLAGRRFVNPATVETQVFDWGTIKWLSEPRVTGTERFTMGVVLLQPGKGHVRHNHAGTEEILYVVSGQGKQMIDIDGEQWEPFAAGDMIHIPADNFHSHGEHRLGVFEVDCRLFATRPRGTSPRHAGVPCAGSGRAAGNLREMNPSFTTRPGQRPSQFL